MENALLINVILLVGSIFLVSTLAWAIPVRLWVEALSAGVTVRIGTLVGMRLRTVSPSRGGAAAHQCD